MKLSNPQPQVKLGLPFSKTIAMYATLLAVCVTIFSVAINILTI